MAACAGVKRSSQQLHVYRGALQNQADVAGQNIGLPVSHIELRHAERQDSAQRLGFFRNCTIQACCARLPRRKIGSERRSVAVEAMALCTLEALEELSKFTCGMESAAAPEHEFLQTGAGGCAFSCPAARW